MTTHSLRSVLINSSWFENRRLVTIGLDQVRLEEGTIADGLEGKGIDSEI